MHDAIAGKVSFATPKPHRSSSRTRMQHWMPQCGSLFSVALDDQAAVREFVLPRIVENKDQKEVIEALAQWYARELAQTGHEERA